MNDQLIQVHNYLRTNGIMICFSGKLSQELIEEYGAAVRKYLEADDRPMNEVSTVFSIFIEQTQNIKNYCSRVQEHSLFEEIHQSSIVTIGKTAEGNYVQSGNLLLSNDAEQLKTRIDLLVGLDKTELKKLYKEKLKQELPSDSTGAGLGLIEIARKATQPLEYFVTPIDSTVSFFTLKACV
jgi:hypothetical protein